MPVDALSELIAYKQIVGAVAREIFFQRNPTRKRVPKGFDERFRLELRGITKGSACNTLIRWVQDDEPRQLALIDGDDSELRQTPDEFDEARDLVLDAIAGDLPSWFSHKTISLFNNFGRTLRNDERISLYADGYTKGPVVYDRTVRKNIVLKCAQTYEDDNAEATGRVVQYDPEAAQFSIRTGDGLRVLCRLDPESPDLMDVRQVVGSAVASQDIHIRVRGRGAFNSQDLLLRFVRVDEISYAEDDTIKELLNVTKRLDVLGTLDAGWCDGEGKKIPSETLEWVRGFFESIIDEDGMPLPRLFPTVEGAVLAQWSFPDAEVCAEFDHENEQINAYGVQIRSRASRSLVVKTPSELMEFVQKFGPPGMSTT